MLNTKDRLDHIRAKARSLMQGPLKHASKAALAAALIPLGVVAVPAQAATTSMSATATTYSDSFVTASDFDSSTTTGANASASPSGGAASATGTVHATGTTYVRAQVDTGGDGGVVATSDYGVDTEAEAQITWEQVFTTGPETISHIFALHFNPIVLHIDPGSSYGSENFLAMVTLDILFDDASIYGFEYVLEGNMISATLTGTTFNPTGAALPSFSCSPDGVLPYHCSTNSLDVFLPLGVLGGSTTHTLKYVVDAYAYAPGAVANEFVLAVFGDPFGLTTGPFIDPPFRILQVQEPQPGSGVVPEPATAVLLSGALAGMFMRRRSGNR